MLPHQLANTVRAHSAAWSWPPSICHSGGLVCALHRQLTGDRVQRSTTPHPAAAAALHPACRWPPQKAEGKWENGHSSMEAQGPIKCSQARPDSLQCTPPLSPHAPLKSSEALGTWWCMWVALAVTRR
jgi:hypothetical protein